MLKIKAGLKGFVKRWCANITDSGGCLLCRTACGKEPDQCTFCTDDTYGQCKILEGKPCLYFERCVLGRPDYRFPLLHCDYPRLFRQYGELNRRFRAVDVTIRLCDCGEPLSPRRKVCDKCQIRNRRKSYRRTRNQNVTCATVN